MTYQRDGEARSDGPLTEEDSWVSPDPGLEDFLDGLYAEADPGPELEDGNEELDHETVTSVARAMAEADDRAAIHADATAHATKGLKVAAIPKGHRNVRWGVVGGLAAAAAVTGIAIAVGIGSTGGPSPSSEANSPNGSQTPSISANSTDDEDIECADMGSPIVSLTLDDGTAVDVYDVEIDSAYVGDLIEDTIGTDADGTKKDCSVHTYLDDSGNPIDGEYAVSLDGGATYHEALKRYQGHD